MNDYTFRPAIREEVGILLGLIGPSGGGKTFSAMRLASGIVGPGGRFAVIDTEARRALHYADTFSFDHCELHPPFRPAAYADAIQAADKAGYKAIVVDSCSHEWSSEGGVLDWQEEELTRMAGNDYGKRESCKMAAWIKPKGEHKRMVSRLLQTKATLILCFRAEEKVKMVKDEKGKMQIVPQGWQPICDKNLPYELTVSFLITPDHPGIGQPIKLQEQHKMIFPAGKLLDESAGRAIAEWAAGGAKPQGGKPADEQGEIKAPATTATPAQKIKLNELMKAQGFDTQEAKKGFYAFVMTSDSQELAESFITRFDDFLLAYSSHIDKQNTPS